MELKIQNQKIDYTKEVTGKDLDLVSYESKFKLWDKVEKEGLLTDKNTDAWKLLNDLTTYCYAFFNDPRTGGRWKMTAYQDAIATKIMAYKGDTLDDNRYIIYRSGNQIGKSGLLIMYAIYKALNEKNVNIILVSKTITQSQFLLNDLRLILNNSKFADTWKEDIGTQDNTTTLTFDKDGGKAINRIICAPAGEGLLGYPINYLLLDEADYYEDGQKFFWKIAYPRANKTKGQIILFSNPNPDIARTNSILYELMHPKSKELGLFKRKFHFKFLDAPWTTQREYDIAQANSPSYIFASTHNGEFSQDAGAFFSEMEIEDMMQEDWNNTLPASDKPVYMGVDVGKMRDYTIITIGIKKKSLIEMDKYDDLDVKYIERLPLKTNYDVILKRMIEIRDYYRENYKGVAKIGYDSTGQKTFGDFLKRNNVQAYGVDFSRKECNKNMLYNDFKLMVENRKVKVVYNEQCVRELSSLEFKVSPTKKFTRVESKTENIHDDIADAIAILIHISVTPSKIPASIRLINSGAPKRNNTNYYKVESEVIKDNTEEFKRSEIQRNTDEYYNKNSVQNGGGF